MNPVHISQELPPPPEGTIWVRRGDYWWPEGNVFWPVDLLRLGWIRPEGEAFDILELCV